MKKKFRTFYILIFFTLITLSLNAQWVNTYGPSNGTVMCFAKLGNNIFAGAYYYGICRTSDNGMNWVPVNNGLITYSIQALVSSGTNIYTGTYNNGVNRSTNNGLNWIAVNNGITRNDIWSLASSDSNIYAGSYNKIFFSSNNGNIWTTILDTSIHAYIRAIVISGSNIFAGTSCGVLLSTNGGLNWSQVNNGLINLQINTLTISGINIYAGTSDGLYMSTNYGILWLPIGLNNKPVVGIANSGSNIFAATGNSGVYFTSNNGVNWIEKNQGFINAGFIWPLFIKENYIFAGASNVWRRELSEITKTEYGNSDITYKFSLSQNYPNPFNPVTNIKYQISNTKFVSLKVFDVLGKEIETLVNEKQSAGTYEVNWNASTYPSGVYFYRLVTDGFTDTKKMILLK